MSLQTRLVALAQAVGADIKSLDTKYNSIQSKIVLDGGASPTEPYDEPPPSDGVYASPTHSHDYASTIHSHSYSDPAHTHDFAATTHLHEYADPAHLHDYMSENFDYNLSATFSDLPSAFPYRVSVRYVSSGVDGPTGSGSWTLLTVNRSSTVVFQIASIRSGTYSINEVYYRNGYEGSTAGPVSGWGPWKKFIFSDEIDSRLLVESDPITIPSDALFTRGSTTGLGTQYTPYTWWVGRGIPDEATNSMGAMIKVPDHWNTVSISVLWSSQNNTTTGNVRLRAVYRDIAYETTMSASGGPYKVVAVNPTNPITLQKTELVTGVGVSNGILFALVERVGSDATDTYAGIMVVYGLVIERVT